MVFWGDCYLQVLVDVLGSTGRNVAMEKLVFLTERMFYQESASDAGYLELCTRFRQQLGGVTQVCVGQRNHDNTACGNYSMPLSLRCFRHATWVFQV